MARAHVVFFLVVERWFVELVAAKSRFLEVILHFVWSSGPLIGVLVTKRRGKAVGIKTLTIILRNEIFALVLDEATVEGTKIITEALSPVIFNSPFFISWYRISWVDVKDRVWFLRTVAFSIVLACIPQVVKVNFRSQIICFRPNIFSVWSKFIAIWSKLAGIRSHSFSAWLEIIFFLVDFAEVSHVLHLVLEHSDMRRISLEIVDLLFLVTWHIIGSCHVVLLLKTSFLLGRGTMMLGWLLVFYVVFIKFFFDVIHLNIIFNNI